MHDLGWHSHMSVSRLFKWRSTNCKWFCRFASESPVMDSDCNEISLWECLRAILMVVDQIAFDICRIILYRWWIDALIRPLESKFISGHFEQPQSEVKLPGLPHQWFWTIATKWLPSTPHNRIICIDVAPSLRGISNLERNWISIPHHSRIKDIYAIIYQPLYNQLHAELSSHFW